MKKKILFIIPSFIRGGVESVTLNILNSLETTLFDIFFIICCKKGENNLIKYLSSDIQVIELGSQNVRGSLIKMRKEIEKIQPNIIFTSFNHLSLPILLYKMLFKKKYKTVVRINTLPSNKLEQSRRGKLYGKIFRYVISDADAVIAQTKEMKKDIKNSYKIAPNKVWVIRNLVDSKLILKRSKERASFSIGSDIFSLISIGSLGEVKGFDILIKAVGELVDRGICDIHLYIIGDNRDKNGNYDVYLGELIDKLNLHNYVSLLGYKANPFPYLSKADAFVLSSIKEGFPNVVLEALTLGKPCLVTNCVDFDGIINPSVNGVIVDKGSVMALVEGIVKIREIEGNSIEFANFDYNIWFSKILNDKK